MKEVRMLKERILIIEDDKRELPENYLYCNY
jgi:hypothetical protein